MSYDFQYEHFKSVYEFDKALATRKNNEVMSNEHSSQRHETDGWSGTDSWEEAESLLKKGWQTKVEEMKIELRKYSQKIERTRIKHKPNVAGFAPIIPAAVKGVPKAMWTATQKTKLEKKNCLHIFFNNNATAGYGSDELMNSGMAVLKLCVFLEKQGVKTKIDILPFLAECGNSAYGCSIAIKDYKQPFNLQKLAYPIAHTALFRRQGFKWLETMEGCKNSGYACSYGRTCEGKILEAYKKQFGFDEEGSIYIGFHDCKDVNYDPEKLAEKFGLLKK